MKIPQHEDMVAGEKGYISAENMRLHIGDGLEPIQDGGNEGGLE